MNGFIRYSFTVALSGYALGAIAAIDKPASFAMGPIDVIPLLKTGVTYDDNIFQNGKIEGIKNKSSTIYQLDPSVEFRAQKGESIYSVVLDAKKRTYTSESDANYTDYGINGLIYQDFNSRNRLNLDFGYGQYHNSGSIVSQTNKKPPEYKGSKAGFMYGFGSKEAIARIDFFGRYSSSDYKKSNGQKDGKDSSNKEYGSTIYYKLMPKTDALLEIKQRELEYKDKISSGAYVGQRSGYDITSYLVGLSWDATAKTTGYAKVGRRYRDSKLKGVDNEGYNGWEVGITYMPKSYSTLELSTNRDYGLVSDSPSSTSFTKGTSSTLSWNHSWTNRIGSRVFYTYTDDKIESAAGATQKNRKTKQFGVAATWKVRRFANLTLGWENTDRSEDIQSSSVKDDSFKRNIYRLTAEFSF